jgi:DNA polymerase-3 subunit delta
LSGQAPLAVAFDATASSDPDGSIASYAWNFGDGSSGTGATASRTYAAAGTFAVQLIVTDDRGATASSTRILTVTAGPPPPSVTISGRITFERVPFSVAAERGLVVPVLRNTDQMSLADIELAIAAYAERPPDDAVLLLLMPKLERDQARSTWYKAVDQAGAIVQIWPVDTNQLAGWVAQRMRQRGLAPAPGVAEMLAERAEGNLLACVQEIEKLLLLEGTGPIGIEQLAGAVADSARFDVYALVDAALGGASARSLRMLHGLRAEGTAETLVLWAIAREVRLLAQLGAALDRGERLDRLLQAHRVWDKRRPLVTQALRRGTTPRWRQALALCADCDRAIKGQSGADSWQILEDLALIVAGQPAPPPAAR